MLLTPRLYRRGQKHITGGQEEDEEEVVASGERLYKCLANLNSEKTANTLSGTDSSHLVKKLWAQSLETEKKKESLH